MSRAAPELGLSAVGWHEMQRDHYLIGLVACGNVNVNFKLVSWKFNSSFIPHTFHKPILEAFESKYLEACQIGSVSGDPYHFFSAKSSKLVRTKSAGPLKSANPLVLNTNIFQPKKLNFSVKSVMVCWQKRSLVK